MAQWCHKYQVEIWAWCLMSNHVHLVAVPHTKEGLARAVGEAHRRYTRRINFREKLRGHLWQERFASFPMDEQHLLATARYVEMNPVGAGLVENPEDYRWSSVHAHLIGKDGELTKVAPLLELVPDWHSFLKLTPSDEVDLLHIHERTGRPLGKVDFIGNLEIELGRRLRPQNQALKRRPRNRYTVPGTRPEFELISKKDPNGSERYHIKIEYSATKEKLGIHVVEIDHENLPKGLQFKSGSSHIESNRVYCDSSTEKMIKSLISLTKK